MFSVGKPSSEHSPISPEVARALPIQQRSVIHKHSTVPQHNGQNQYNTGQTKQHQKPQNTIKPFKNQSRCVRKDDIFEGVETLPTEKN